MTKHSMGQGRGLMRALLALGLAALMGGCIKNNGTKQCVEGVDCPPKPVPANTLRVHYFRTDGAYTGWGVYSWEGPVTASGPWPATPYAFDTADANGWGYHTDIALTPSAAAVKFLLNKQPNGDKDGGDRATPDGYLAGMDKAGKEIWIKQDDAAVYTTEPAKLDGIVLANAKAGFVDYDGTDAFFAWPGLSVSGKTFKLYAASMGGLASDGNSITSPASSYSVLDVATGATLSDAAAAKWPRWAAGPILKVSGLSVDDVKNLLKGQLALVATKDGVGTDGTQVQTGPAIDAVYGEAAAAADLGVTFNGIPTIRSGRLAKIAVSHVPTFRLFAPTAKAVKINLYAAGTGGAAPTVQAMELDPATGVWSYTAPDATSYGKYYTYSVTVFSRAADSTVVENEVTDPYSVSLSQNSARSMILDLTDAATKPASWDGQTLLATSEVGNESAIYELHIRDFSANDATVPAAHVGKFLAFTDPDTDGRNHLEALAAAGLTHVHILPAFDIATVNEGGCLAVTVPASTGAGDEAQAYLGGVRNDDCFNWGYDPLHYGAPEGSYATDNGADGALRVKEFRQMVLALHEIGLRVTMDVVYNHTNAAGQAPKSVLDRIVPGYYNRLGATGQVLTDTCCSDTSTESVMFEKLMRETLVRWADQYKVDSFRHDLMGFIPKAAIVASQADLDAVAQADGRGHIYVYGEGWNFGAVADNRLFVQATQNEMAGTNIGTFNDRLRDAVRGGGPFDGGDSLVTNQGFVNGQCYDPNGAACTNDQLAAALNRINWIELGLAGNLKDFELKPGLTGAQVDYNGSPAAYASSPADTIEYTSKHDNQTLFDLSQYKHPAATSSADRARAQIVGMAIPALSQGVPFFQAGDDLLRSKSMDADSYDSGDYFNRIWWNGSRNNWAVGRPPQWRNEANWPTMTPILNDASRAVTEADILWTRAAFLDFLSIRKDTSMFHLPTAAAIKACVKFPDQTIGQKPGLIVMQIGGGVSCGDNKYASIVVLFNANKVDQSIAIPAYVGNSRVSLHQIQATGSDPVVKGSSFTSATGTFTAKARTVAVFVEEPQTSVLLDETQATVAAGAQHTFTAHVVHATDTSLTWSVQEAGGGTVTAGGVYTAPNTVGTYHVVATSNEDNTKKATIEVTVPWVNVDAAGIDPMFGAAAEAGAGSGWGAKIENVYVTSHDGVVYVAAAFNPLDSGNNVYLYIDNTNVATGTVDLQADVTLGWGDMKLANTAAANVDFAFAGWRGGTTLNAGPSHKIVSGASSDVGADVTVGKSNTYKWAIKYSALGAVSGNAIRVYVLFGKDNGPGGIHSVAPAQSAAQVTLMNDGGSKGLSDLDTAAPSVTLN